jgi:hypothetical protein
MPMTVAKILKLTRKNPKNLLLTRKEYKELILDLDILETPFDPIPSEIVFDGVKIKPPADQDSLFW